MIATHDNDATRSDDFAIGQIGAEHFYEVFTQTEAESALAAGIFHRKEVPIGEVKKHLTGKVEIRL